MSVISTSNVTGLLAQVYDRQSYSINFERTYSPFWSRVKSFNKGGAPLGISRRWSVRTFDAWNVQGIAEGGDFPAINQSQNIQPYVNAVSIAGATGWTEQALLQITGEGSLGATSILSDSVDELTRNYFQLLNKYCMGHGTGRLAVVQDTTDTLTTFVCKLPESHLMLRTGMYIDAFTAETGGSQEITNIRISAIAPETRTVTLASAQTVTAGDSVYISGGRGIAPNGLRGMADDGTLTSTIFNITRSSYPDINSLVVTPSGSSSGTIPYSERLIRETGLKVWFKTGVMPNEIWTNYGIVSAYLDSLTGSRIFTVAPGQTTPTYTTGNGEDVTFSLMGKSLKFNVDGDFPARELVMGDFSGFRKHVLREPSWSGDGVSADGTTSPILLQGTASTAARMYSFNKVAGMLGMFNLAHVNTRTLARISGIGDSLLGGDATGSISA